MHIPGDGVEVLELQRKEIGTVNFSTNQQNVDAVLTSISSGISEDIWW